MADNVKTPLVSFKYGTPEPVTFRETMGTDWFDEEMKARTAMSINVYDYDAKKYKDGDSLVAAVKAGMFDMIEKALEKMSEVSVVRDRPHGRLSKALEKELSEAGVTAEVDVFSFALTEESERLCSEVRECIINSASVDRTDRPCEDFLKKLKPDCVPQGDPGKMNDLFLMNTQRYEYCIECGTKREENANFCTGCGYKFTV
ncbi:MAG: hypothetical protein IKH51_08420 [Clostridia bacterium]|nr:hypothetical protein [Clostridia bacterium]